MKSLKWFLCSLFLVHSFSLAECCVLRTIVEWKIIFFCFVFVTAIFITLFSFHIFFFLIRWKLVFYFRGTTQYDVKTKDENNAINITKNIEENNKMMCCYSLCFTFFSTRLFMRLFNTIITVIVQVIVACGAFFF